MDIAIIGAGASGMAAALQAASRDAEVTLLERNAGVGKKLLVTGAGRCNITNREVLAERYACEDPSWVASLLDAFGVKDLICLLEEIGVPVYATDDGWCYPRSNSAQSVVDAFAAALQIAGVKVRTNTKVAAIDPLKGGFRLELHGAEGRSQELFSNVIVAAGGMAYPSLGTRGELFTELSRLGHTVLPLRPALAPVLAEIGPLKELQGVRLDAGVTLYRGEQALGGTLGNLIFTSFGLNGPGVMDLSHLISARPGEQMELSLDVLKPHEEAIQGLLARKRKSPLPVSVLLEAFLPPKAAGFYARQSGLAVDAPLERLADGELERLIHHLRDTRLAVKGVRDFEYCQVSAGGVPVGEVDARTMESKKVRGLYLVGETLDVVGPCGGYNLQYAFSSGALAGRGSLNLKN